MFNQIILCRDNLVSDYPIIINLSIKTPVPIVQDFILDTLKFYLY